MSYKWIMSLTIILSLTVFIPIAQAQQPYDITECYTFTFTILSEGESLRVLGYDAKGIVRSVHENKVFDNCTLHSVGIRRDMFGKAAAHGYFKYMDPDGDIFIMEGVATEEVATMKFIYGTGRWKGIKGEGKLSPITGGKPIIPGTAQICYRHAGIFELPK